MCRYCDYDIFTHYLLNDAPSLKDAIEFNPAAAISNEAIEDESLVSELQPAEATEETSVTGEVATESLEESLDDLSVTEISTTEDKISTFQVLETAFETELKGDIEYSATLVNSKELPDWISLDSETGKLTLKAEYEEIGIYEIVVQATDDFGESASTIVAIEVIGKEGEDTLLEEDQLIPVSDPETGLQYDNFVALETISLPKIFVDDVQTTDSSIGRELTFTVRLDAASTDTVTVDYTTADDTAMAGEDYLAANGTVTFAPGETKKTFSVNTTGTSFLDPDENFLINLSNATNATIKDDQGKGTILPAYAGIRGWTRSQSPVTFSFFNEDLFGQGGYDGSKRESNAKEPSDVVKAHYRQIFDHLNTLVDREFVEVEETESQVGNIRIVVSDGPDYAYAGGHIHLAGWAAASDARINGWEAGRGKYSYSALLHELGHALGMPHSFGKDSSVFDPEDNSSNTVMSYTYPGRRPATFMAYDIKSLQERYGAAEYRPEDTVYEFLTIDNYLVNGEIAIDTTRSLKQTIWDSGGTDTFDFSSLAVDDSGYRFDLNQSQYQTTQSGYQGSSYSKNGTTYYVPNYGTSIAIDVEIENLINSSSDDIIIANPAANTFSGYGLGLTTGDDTLIGTDNFDTLDLSGFAFFDVAKTQVEDDLEINLGLADSVTIQDYFATAEANRINILLDDIEASINDVAIVEGNSGLNTANFIVNLSQASSELIELNYTTVDGNAKAGSDYTAKTGTVTFNPGQTSKTIAVAISGDIVGEADETFNLNLLGSYGQVIAEGTGTITNDDGTVPLPTLTITDTSATNGNNAAKATFNVSLDRAHDTAITVDYTTIDGVAVAGEDYTANNGTLTFAPGETEKTIEVDILSNTSNRDEDFKVQLSNVSSNATISDSEGIGNIIDPTFNIGFADGSDTNLALASYPPDLEKDPTNLPFDVSPDRTSLTIEGDGNGWKEVQLVDDLATRDSPLNPYTVVEFDFKTTEAGKLHGLHFESRDHHDFYSPWESGRFFQLHGSDEFGIQDFNSYEDSFGEWKTYQIPVGQFIDNTIHHDGNSKAVQWLVFAHEGNSDDSNSQFRNVEFKELLPISIAGVTVNEADGVASFILTLPEASIQTITLDYATANDNAVAGQDYTAASGTVTFNAGETSKTIDIAIADDSESEGDESFSLNLSNASNAIALSSEVTATITDNDDPLPVISVADLNLDEGNTGTTTASVTVSLDKSWTEAITVDYSTLDNTAITEEDYTAAEGTITFDPGETSKTINLAIKGDALNETDESFFFNLANAVKATVNDPQAEVTINNDDSLPSIDIEDAGVLSSIPVRDSNGNIKNTTGLLFTVTLDAPSNQTIKVDYITADNTAVAGEDYTARNRTLTFQPGETEKRVFVGVTLDDTEEADETLYLNLTNPENATIADNQAIGTIEETRSLSVSDLEISEDGTEALFTVSLDKPSVQGVFVNYATQDGTAKAGADYTSTSGRLLIKAGESSATIAVPLINNNITEENETFFLNLTKPKYVLVEDDRGQATILNDDAIPTENPGGIYQDLQLWLKADAGLTTADKTVSSWKDSSQGANDFTELFGGTNPSLKTEGINFNPTVEFIDTSDRLGSSNINNFPTNEITQFLVLQRQNPSRNEAYFSYANSQSNEFLLFNSGSETQVTINNSSRNVAFSIDDNPVVLGVDWQAGTGTGHLYNNGNSFEFTGSTSPVTAVGTIVLGEEQDSQGGGFSSSQAFLGQIAENIIFDRVLTAQERQQIESYLGIKYGTTIDQTTATNYLAANGSIIWNATTAGDYKHDIAGIAIDSASGLSQVKSRSSNNDSIVTIDNASNLANGEALIWSNNDSAIAAESVSLTNGIYHLTRQWQVQETGDVGKVNLSFDLTGLGYLTDNANQFSLLIDNDGDFSDATVHKTGLQVNGNQISFSDVDLQNGSYFTLAVPEKQAPGGIKSNLQLWLRGDSAVSNEVGVTQWGDRSGKERNYTPNDVNNQPVLGTNKFNFNSVVNFDGNDTLITSRENFTQGEVFFVLRGQDNGSNSNLLSDRSRYNTSYLKFEQWNNTGKLGFTRRSIRDYASQINSPFNELSLVSFSSADNSNLFDITVENKGNITQDSLDIGASRPIPLEYLAQGFKGEIAEVVVFDSVLSQADKLKLRSNLALKYGLTLDTTADYVNSDNQVWWDRDLAGDYNNDVSGIAKDDSSDLAQVKSRSSNAGSIVTIAAEDTANGLEDGEALVWGNKDQTANNNVLQVDGINDYVAIPDSDAIDFSKDQDFTIEVKVKTDGSTANDAIVEKWGQGGGYPFVIRYMSDGTVRAARYDGSNNPGVRSSSNINDGEFHHVAFVKEGNQLKLYIDGNLEGTSTDSTTGTTANNTPVYLGSRGGNSEFFKGNLEDVRIWNIARTAAEIKASQGSVAPDSSGLVAYLPLENDAKDLTGNSHNGTLNNGAAIVSVEAIDLSQRIWQVQESQGDVGKVSVSFDLSQLNQQLELEDYAIAIASNDSFSDAKFHTAGGKIAENMLTFTGVDFNNGEYFTLDTENRDRVINNTGGTEIKVNAAGGTYTDVSGGQWRKSEGLSNGRNYSTRHAIAQTEDDLLYQSEYYGQDFSYDAAVANGNYDVTLKFAEIYFSAAGKRVFDVTIEDQLVLDDFDIFAEAGGKNIALDRTFTVEVTDGNIDLDFLGSVNNAKISAIEIEPNTFTTKKVNAAGGTYTDIDGGQWRKSEGLSNGRNYSTRHAIAQTEDDLLYQSEYYGQDFSYDAAVANGNYDVTLKFAEIYFSAAGKRVFDVTIEDQLVLDDFDIFAEAGGKNIALDRTFTVEVTDGNIDLDFLGSVNNAKISAIEIEPLNFEASSNSFISDLNSDV